MGGWISTYQKTVLCPDKNIAHPEHLFMDDLSVAKIIKKN